MSSDSERQQKIIEEQAQDLARKENQYQDKPFHTKSTILSDESGVNETGIRDFPGASVSVGRTGQTGGGTNAQLIPPEEGGEGRAGTSSAIYEDPRGGKSDIQADIARNDPSQVRNDSDNVRKETGIAGARPPQELQDDQEATAQGRV